MNEQTAALQKLEPREVVREPVTPNQMLAIALERGADMEQLSKLMDLQERWEANEARKAYVSALAAFKAEPPTVVKNRRVRYKTDKGTTQYDHASLDQVANAIAPALAKQGLSHRWSTEQSEKGISVTCTLTHALGHSESVTLSASADNSGSKNSIQAIGSTVTYLERYTLLAITGLATEDMDDDGLFGGKGETISAEQKDELIALIKEVDADTRAFLDYLGYATVDDIQAKDFSRAKAALEKKREKKDG